MTDLGIQPDLVAGHSYGEFAALTAADAWDVEGVVTAARARYDAIEATPTARGTLMATTAPPHVIEQTAAALAERTYLANFNAPDQTVVGGSPAALAQLSQLLNAAGHKSQVLSVPCPYHTPLLEGAGAILKRTLDTLRMRPPRVPLLSTVTNRYVAEPDDIRANLAAQLTTPVRYVDLIHRIAEEQDTVFVEVGPQQALTKLNRRILDGENIVGVIACDNAKQPGVEQLYCVRALAWSVWASLASPSLSPKPRRPRKPAAPTAALHARAAIAPRSPQPAMTKPDKGTITHFDATQRRVEKMRQMAAGGPKASNGHHTPTVANGTPGTMAATVRRARGAQWRCRVPRRRDSSCLAASAAATGCNTPAPTAPAARSGSPAAPRRCCSVAPAGRKPPPAAPGLNPAELEKFLINFVVEQTGYPPEVVELDVDLEADLGIDSIKKAQLFGELAEYFDVQPDENMTLDDFPTLRHVLNFLAAAPMKSQPAGTQAAAPARGSPAAPAASRAAAPSQRAAPAPAAASRAASPSLNPAELEKFLINFVVEQTGYPPEVVELDADLEADLGIDSIKKAQLFGELAEYFDVQPDENMTLDDFPTLRHVVNFLAAAPMKGDLPAAAPQPAPVPRQHRAGQFPGHAVPAPAPTPVLPPAPRAAGSGCRPGLNPAELEKFMINFVVEQTGYPPEVVELDADLEADLGIDSIKKAQLFGELAEYFDVQPDENMTLDDFPTLRHVVNFLAAAPMKSDLPRHRRASQPRRRAAHRVPVAAAAAPAAPAPIAPAAAPPAGCLAQPRPGRVGKVPDQLRRRTDGLSAGSRRARCRSGSRPGHRQHQEGPALRRVGRVLRRQPDENLTLDDFPTLRHVMDFLAGSGLKKNLTPDPSEPSQASPAANASAPVRVAAPPVAPQPAAAPTSPPTPAPASSPRFEAGLARGNQQRAALRQLLHRLADRADDAAAANTAQQFTADELDELRGIAAGINVSLSGVLAHGKALFANNTATASSSPATAPSRPQLAAPSAPPTPVEDGPRYDLEPEDFQRDDTHRFFLRELELPFDPAAPSMPTWHGAALIVGEHPLGDALRRQLESAGVTVRQLPISNDLDETLAAFDRIWDEQPTPHVFIVTGREPAVDPMDESAWRRRWYRVATMPYFLGQRWVQRAGEAKLLDRCSLIGATSLNGTLGFSGEITSPECGAITGLMKAIYIEVAIMREQRSMRAKAVDAPPDEPLDLLAANICRELASKEVDYEVAFVGGKRYVQCAYPEKAPVKQLADLRPGGTWVVTGGARGITAECALELGRRFGLKLHLIGTSPLREIDPSWRNLSAEGMKSLESHGHARSARGRAEHGSRLEPRATRHRNRPLDAGAGRGPRPSRLPRVRRRRTQTPWPPCSMKFAARRDRSKAFYTARVSSAPAATNAKRAKACWPRSAPKSTARST